MARKTNFLSPKEYNSIVNDVNDMFHDNEISISLVHKETGEISLDITSGLMTDPDGTSTAIPAHLGGYGQISRRRVGNVEGERPRSGSLLPFKETYFLVAKADMADPDAIDRIVYDGIVYRVTNIDQDTLRTHWRIEAEKT